MSVSRGHQPQLRAEVQDLIGHLDAVILQAEVVLGRWDAVDTLPMAQLERLGSVLRKTLTMLSTVYPIFANAKAKRTGQSVSGRLQNQVTALSHHVQRLETQVRALGETPSQ